MDESDYYKEQNEDILSQDRKEFESTISKKTDVDADTDITESIINTFIEHPLIENIPNLTACVKLNETTIDDNNLFKILSNLIRIILEVSRSVYDASIPNPNEISAIIDCFELLINLTELYSSFVDETIKSGYSLIKDLYHSYPMVLQKEILNFFIELINNKEYHDIIIDFINPEISPFLQILEENIKLNYISIVLIKIFLII